MMRQQHRVQHDAAAPSCRAVVAWRGWSGRRWRTSVMPVNAARYGVRPLTRMPISSTSGISVGQRWRSDSRSLGISSSVRPRRPLRLASKCTCMNTPKKCMKAGTTAAAMMVWYGTVEELDHQERGGAQHRRRDLAAGRRRRLDRAGELARVADADHRGNGERAHRHRVGHRRAGQHAEHRRAEHADLGRPAGIAAGDRSRRCRGTAGPGRCAWPARRTARSGRRRSPPRRPRRRRCPGW